MFNWYDLGKKVGQHMISTYLAQKNPLVLISPHDLEDEYYEIKDMLDSQGINLDYMQVATEDYLQEIVNQLPTEWVLEQQLLLLGQSCGELEILLAFLYDDEDYEYEYEDEDEDEDEIDRDPLHLIKRAKARKEDVCRLIDKLTMSDSLKNITMDRFVKDEFQAIDREVLLLNTIHRDVIDNARPAQQNIYHVSGVGNTVGQNNNNKGNSYEGNVADYSVNNYDIEKLIDELKQAEELIRQSADLSEEAKMLVIDILEETKTAVTENSPEKISKATKKCFGLKDFLIKTAPTIIGALANLTKLASFFGITPVG